MKSTAPQLTSFFRVTIAGDSANRSATFQARSASQITIGIEPDHIQQGGSSKVLPVRTFTQTTRVRIEVPVSSGRSPAMNTWWNDVTDSSKRLAKRTIDIVQTNDAGDETAGYRLMNAWPCKVGASSMALETESAALTEFYEFVYEEIEILTGSKNNQGVSQHTKPVTEAGPVNEVHGKDELFETKALVDHELFQYEDHPQKTKWLDGPVKYCNEEERKTYQLTLKDGKLLDHEGKPFDTTKGSSHWSGAGTAIMVMDESGNIYASNVHAPGMFHHSSFLAGKPVAFAGEIKVREGQLLWMSNKSGHYRPPTSMFKQFEQVLAGGGIDPTKVKKEVFS